MSDATITLCVTSRSNAKLACDAHGRVITLHTFARPAPTRFEQDIAMQSFTFMVQRHASRQYFRHAGGSAHSLHAIGSIAAASGAVCESACDVRMRHRLERAVIDGVLRRKPVISPAKCHRSTRWQRLLPLVPSHPASLSSLCCNRLGDHASSSTSTYRSDCTVEQRKSSSSCETLVVLSPVSESCGTVSPAATHASLADTPHEYVHMQEKQTYMNPYETFEQAHKNRPVVMHTLRDKLVYVVEVDSDSVCQGRHKNVRESHAPSTPKRHRRAACDIVTSSNRRRSGSSRDNIVTCGVDNEYVERCVTELAFSSAGSTYTGEESVSDEPSSLTRAPVSSGSCQSSHLGNADRWCDGKDPSQAARPHTPTRRACRQAEESGVCDTCPGQKDTSCSPLDEGGSKSGSNNTYTPSARSVHRLTRAMGLRDTNHAHSARTNEGISLAARPQPRSHVPLIYVRRELKAIARASRAHPLSVTPSTEAEHALARGEGSSVLQQIARVRAQLHASREQISLALAADRELGRIWSEEYIRNKSALHLVQSLIARLDAAEKVVHGM